MKCSPVFGKEVFLGLCDLWNVVPGKPSRWGYFYEWGLPLLTEPFRRSVCSAARGSGSILETRLTLGMEEKYKMNPEDSVRTGHSGFGGRPALWGRTLNC